MLQVWDFVLKCAPAAVEGSSMLLEEWACGVNSTPDGFKDRAPCSAPLPVSRHGRKNRAGLS